MTNVQIIKEVLLILGTLFSLIFVFLGLFQYNNDKGIKPSTYTIGVLGVMFIVWYLLLNYFPAIP